ncbi:hypothetical protein [Geomonas ferrireducens]|uniref:hypothetical protein n=1 Tax=Geomonas ferrireducens TaxID=2570227 RepID=UPI0010A7A71A|nr:hypothetical protein [Geomonas ferrireducens]
MAEDNTYRFAVGQKTTIRSSVWRLWTKSNDIFLAVRTNAGQFKISFHGSGVCQIGLTTQFVEEVKEQLAEAGKDRSLDRWRRPVAPDKEKILYCVLFPQFCLRAEPESQENTSAVAWQGVPGEGNMRVFTLTISNGNDADKPREQRPLLQWILPSREILRLYTSIGQPSQNLIYEYEKVAKQINSTSSLELGERKLPEGNNRMALFMTRDDGIKFAIDIPVYLTYNNTTAGG